MGSVGAIAFIVIKIHSTQQRRISEAQERYIKIFGRSPLIQAFSTSKVHCSTVLDPISLSEFMSR